MTTERTILDGTALAGEIESELKSRVERLVGATGRTPALATILVGDDPSSRIYVRMKGDACRRIGLEPRRVELPGTSSTADVIAAIDALNADADVYGILLQHPVPKGIDERACFDRISAAKDVDGVTSANFGRMALGEKTFVSATPGGIMKLLARYAVPVAGKNAVVVGRSAILGKPVAMLLLEANATVTICHSKTGGLSDIVRGADIVVAAVGKREFVRADWIREGAVIIDAGYHPGKQGDVERAAYDKASAYTPVPGGVGPMTIATLMCQTVEAAERSLIRK